MSAARARARATVPDRDRCRGRGGPPGGVSNESVRRWLAQADVDDGTRPGVTSVKSAEVQRLKAQNKHLREDSDILRGEARPPQPLILAFIDEMRAEGHAVESICGPWINRA